MSQAHVSLWEGVHEERCAAFDPASLPPIFPDACGFASAVMCELYEIAAMAAASDIPILIHGETGTGKEILAHYIHRKSAYANGPFAIVDCAGLPESLVESELFGCAKGAYTGADRARAGLIDAGNGGTVFIDELGELPGSAQAKLLRALDTGQIRAVGSTTYRLVRMRVVAATHRDLDAEAAAGRFRSDLLFRIGSVRLRIPPLREHPEDIPALANAFLAAFGADFRLDSGTLGRLMQYPWPGNVRELKNCMQCMAQVGVCSLRGTPSSRFVRSCRIADHVFRESQACTASAPVEIRCHSPLPASASRRLEDIESAGIRAALARHEHLKDVARELGIGRTTLYRKMKRFGFSAGGRFA